MKLIVTDSADQFLRNRLHLQAGDGVRLYSEERPGRIHHGARQKAVKTAAPQQPVFNIIKNGISYYVSLDDDWFFSGLTTTVDYTPQRGLYFAFSPEQKDGKTQQGPDATTAPSQKFEDFWE